MDPVERPAADDPRWLRTVGWLASGAAILMYVSYLPQIALNLEGHKGSALQPLAAMINCSLWCGYALMRRVRDWPIALANAPGVLLGGIAFVTAL